jgi:hypothetical protein
VARTFSRELDIDCPINWDWEGNYGLTNEYGGTPVAAWRGVPTLRDLTRGRSAAGVPADLARSGNPAWQGDDGKFPGLYGSLYFDGSSTGYFSGPTQTFGTDLTLSVLTNPAVPSWGTTGQSYAVFGVSNTNGAIITGLYFYSPAPGIEARFVNDAGSGNAGYWKVTGLTWAARWYHLAVTQIGPSGTPTLYVNGVPYSMTNILLSGTPTRPSRPLYYGTLGSAASQCLIGSIAHAAVYNRALGAAEAVGLYDQLQRGSPNRLRWLSKRAWFPVTAGGGAAYTLTAGAGSFALTGKPATLTAARKLTAGVASFLLTGKPATLTAARALTAAAGSFTLTGKPATLTAGRALAASAGSFTLTGKPATMLFGYTLTAAAGSFALTGKAATLTTARKLTAAAGSFALTGKPAGLAVGRQLAAAAGSFALTGGTATLRATRVLTAAAGSFTLTGRPATLTVAGGTPPLGVTLYATVTLAATLAGTVTLATEFNATVDMR